MKRTEVWEIRETHIRGSCSYLPRSKNSGLLRFYLCGCSSRTSRIPSGFCRSSNALKTTPKRKELEAEEPEQNPNTRQEFTHHQPEAPPNSTLVVCSFLGGVYSIQPLSPRPFHQLHPPFFFRGNTHLW